MEANEGVILGIVIGLPKKSTGGWVSGIKLDYPQIEDIADSYLVYNVDVFLRASPFVDRTKVRAGWLRSFQGTFLFRITCYVSNTIKLLCRSPTTTLNGGFRKRRLRLTPYELGFLV